MKNKTRFQTSILTKKLLIFLMTILSYFSLWSQNGYCGFDDYVQVLLEKDEGYAEALAQANQQITDAINQNPNIGEHGFVIPVVVHIMHNEMEEDVNENIPDQQVFRAIDLLNDQFAGLEGNGQPIFSADTGIRFQLATIDPDCNTTNGIVRVPTDEPFGSSDDDVTDTDLKNQSRWPTESYLNIWVVEDIISGVDGYVPAFPPNSATDGVVIRHNRFGDSGTAQNQYAPTTLAHEVGHYLSLVHLYGLIADECERCYVGIDCQQYGDFVCDTEPCASPFPVGQGVDCTQAYPSDCLEQCNPNAGDYAKESYMTHFAGECRTGFSPGQATRMCAAIETFRKELVSLSSAVHTGIIDESIATYQDPDVSSNTTWNLPPGNTTGATITINGNLTIKSGKTLTVSPGVVVIFGPNSNVIIERGARLIMNGSTFTSQCGDTWPGIQVRGRSNQGQHSGNQGYISLDNASIEHADIGIITANIDSPRGTTGGIVQAENSTFRNNRVDVEFRAYRNKHFFTGDEIGNASRFENSRSFITDNYRFPFDDTDSGMQGFLRLRGVHGIPIKGHHFEDQRTILGAERPSGKIGIESFKAGFLVDQWCEGNVSTTTPANCNGNRTQFINLGYGIAANLNNYPRFGSSGISINSSDFDCWHGIHALGISGGPTVQLNEFNVRDQEASPLDDADGDGEPDWEVVAPYGLHLDNCIGYTVQNNSFTSDNVAYGNNSSGTQTAGIVVRNNHGGSEEIYNNTFHRMTVGCGAIAQNWGTDPLLGDIGLEFRCNDFTECGHDIFVSPEANPNLTPANINGIMPMQYLPGNRFSVPPNYRNIYKVWGLETITYSHHDDTVEPRVVPERVSNVTVEDEEDVFDLNNACPNFLPPDGEEEWRTGGEALTMLRNIKEDHNHLLQTTRTNLQNMTDDGNTALLLVAVNHPNIQRSFQAYTNIMNQAPFTSDEVLKAVSIKETGWSNGMIRNVLVAHPQAAKSGTIQENLDSRSNPLPPFMRNQINVGLNTIGEKEQMEITINRHRRERNRAINQAISVLATDTLDHTVDIIDLLSNTGDIQYEYRLAEAYDAIGDREEAEKILNNINFVGMSEATAQAHTDYMSFRQLQQTWANQEKNLADLPEEDIAQLQDYTQRANTTAGSAIALLRLNGIHTYKEPVYFPDDIAQLRVAQYTEEIINENQLDIYPNPANQYVTVAYAIPELSSTSSLTITNINGQIVYQEKLAYPKDELVIITDKFPPGQYFCTLSDTTNALKTEKFILIK